MKKKIVRRNFIGAIVLITALLIIIPVITLSLLTREYDAKIRTETEQSSTSIRQTVRAFINGAYSLSYEMSVNPTILTMDGALQTPILVDCVERNEYLELLYIQGPDGHQTARSSGELGYRGERAWFLKIMEHRQPYVQESYYSIATGMPVTSVFIPMYRDSELVGIFGADISLRYFRRLAEEFADEENGRLSFIIDGEGVVVAHPDITLLETITNFKTQTRTVPLTDENGVGLLNPDGSVVTEIQSFLLSPGYKAMIDDVMAGNRGLKIIEADGKTYYASYESIEMPGYSNSWSVITLQDRDIAMSTIFELIYRVLIIIAIIFAVFIFIAFGFFGSLNKTMDSLETARIEAEEANKSKSVFLSTMSHEIRTPMNAILGIVEILLGRDDLNKEVREALERTHSSGNMLLNIINDILDLSKIEAGKLEIIDADYEIASLISDTVQLNMMRICSKPIEFVLHADENLPRKLLGDELRVKQILNNLLSNAFKYTDKGKVGMTVTSEPADSQSDDTIDLIFKISDTGQGMTKEQVTMLFSEYTRFNLQANRKTEGTGLGLNITYKLVKMMDGDISAESTPGEGTVFNVRIRQGKIGTEVLGKELAENLSRFRAGSSERMRRMQIKYEPMPYGSVMIVDDVETNIYVARGLLAPYGLKIDSAESGSEAIEKIENGNIYDVIFMDHMMPDMDGIEATKRIRALGYKDPIVALTANAVSGQAEKFMSSGFDDFISKPIDMRRMNTILNKLVRDKQPPEVIKEARKNRTAAASGSIPGGVTASMVNSFLRDAKKAAGVLDNIMKKDGTYSTDDMRSFTVNVHGLKSILTVIGKPELSDSARELEILGREENAGAIAAKAPQFISSLHALIEEITKSIADNPESQKSAKDSDTALLREKLSIIKSACQDFDSKTADKVLRELNENRWSKETSEMLETISKHLLHSEFDEIKSIAARYLESVGQ